MKRFAVKIIDENNSREIDLRDNLLSVDFDALDRGSLNDVVEYGIYSNSGEITFFDRNKEFYNISDNGNADLKAEIYLASDYYSRKIATFIIDDYSCDETTQKVSLSLIDVLLSWQKIQIPRIFLYVARSAATIITEIFSRVKDKSVTIVYDEGTQEVLNDVYCGCPDLKPDTLWNDITKICQLCQCRVFCNENGVPQISVGNAAQSSFVVNPRDIRDIGENYRRRHTKHADFFFKLANIKKHKGSILQQKQNVELYQYEKFAVAGGNNQYTWTTTRTGEDTAEIDISYYGDDDSPNFTGIGTTSVDISFSLPLKDTAYYKEGDETLGKLKLKTSETLFEGSGNFIESEGRVVTDTDEVTDYKLISNRGNTQYLEGSFDINEARVDTASAPPSRIVLSVEFDIEGQYYTNLEDVENGTSSSGDNAVEIASNELMQVINTIGYPYGDRFDDYSEWYANRLEAQLGKGTECYAIRCMLTDYYTDSGSSLDSNGVEKPIESFAKYDVIRPYIIRKGRPSPLSVDENGKSKVFKIIGIKYNFKGVIWQTLYVQEVHSMEL